MYKKLLKNTIFLLISILLFSALYYYKFIEIDLYLISKLIILLIFFFNTGYIVEINSKKRFKRSIIFIIVFIFLSLFFSLFNNIFLLKQLIYYLVISLITLLGSLFNRSKKRN